MATAPRVLRALDPAERYFWLLGRIASVNGVLSAYVDRTFDEGELTDALRGLQRRHPLLRARVDVVDDELVFVEADGEIPLTVLPLAPGQPSRTARLEVWPFEPAPHPLAACIYEPVEGEERSVVTLNVHHVLVDGNMARTVLQQLMRMIDEGATDVPVSDVVPDPLHARFPEALRSPRAAVEVVRAVRAERDGQLPTSDFTFHDRLAPGLRPRNDLLALEGDALAAYLARAKAQGASVTGLLGADILRAGAALFEVSEPRMLNFASAVDLRPRVEPPLPVDAAMVAIGMLCTPYLVSDETRDTLGRTIGDQIAREVARGESHLFYRFARVATFPPTDAGEAAFAKWVDSAPQNITVSSLGRIDDAGDPPWLSRMAPIMAATPNQVAFIATLTYRGELTISVATDSAKLAPEVADRFVSEIAARTGARLEATTTFDPADASVGG
jgi:hypothetical protein